MIPWRFRPTGIAYRAVVARSGSKVMAGPFAGMNYVRDAHGSSLPPKLIGCYERELHPVLAAYKATPVDVVIDIGAAEGYYAVGFLYAGLAKQTVAYEAVPAAGEQVKELARLNGVADKVRVAGLCQPGDLQAELTAVAGRRVLVMVDAEGAEDVLLDPAQVPAIRTADILVEMHDFAVPGVTDRVQSRFAGTHTIRRFDQEPRSAADNPCQTWLTRLLPARYAAGVVHEKRPAPMHWLWLQPK
jgi:FkbM family methyltransferase